jgi:hypothetical protein
VRKLNLIAALAALVLGACRDVPVPIDSATAVEIPFDDKVPRRHPGNVHTYGLQAIVPREAIGTIAAEELYTYVHVTRCADRQLIAIAETRLENIDMMDFEALRRKLKADPTGDFQIDAKFSSPSTLRSGEACLAFNGGSYLAREATSRPTGIVVREAPKS